MQLPPQSNTHGHSPLSIPLGAWGEGPPSNPRAGTLTLGIDCLAADDLTWGEGEAAACCWCCHCWPGPECKAPILSPIKEQSHPP